MITAGTYFRERFGHKMYKASISLDVTCPNRDGSKGTGGCTFCSAGGSGEFSEAPGDVTSQIDKAIERVKSKAGENAGYIAYFQSFTNTYCEAAYLEEALAQAVSHPKVEALSIATRPDCLEDSMVEYLAELSDIKPVWVELGLQTSNSATARAMNRCYELDVFDDAYHRLKRAGIEVIVHIILGLPGEDESDMMETARYIAQLQPAIDGIKIHMLQILKGTALEKQYRERPFHVLTMEEYTDIVIKILRMLPAGTVIHRFTGDGPKKILIEPQWCWEKKKVLNYMNRQIAKA